MNALVRNSDSKELGRKVAVINNTDSSDKYRVMLHCILGLIGIFNDASVTSSTVGSKLSSSNETKSLNTFVIESTPIV